MKQHNQEIRILIDAAKQQGINKYQIAYAIGVSETTFSRYFRKPMTLELQEKIKKAIEVIKKESQINSS